MMSREIILIDSKNVLYRMAHVFNNLSTAEGFPTGTLFGCLNAMLSLHTRLPEAAMVWVWDGRGETWRHKFMSKMPQLDTLPEPEEEDDPMKSLTNSYYANLDSVFGTDIIVHKRVDGRKPKEKKKGYKANRVYSSMGAKKKNKYPEDVRERAYLQIPVLQMILQGCGIRSYEIEELECDDLLAMLVKRAMELDDDCKIYVHSGDRDYYQLLQYDQVRIITKVKEGKLHKVRAEDVLQEYGVDVKDWAKYRALTGDSSDNIPHLFKVGSVRAKKMLEAGIDPSQAKCSSIPDEAKEEFGKYFEPHGIERMWPSMHGNYKLCKLVDDPKDVLLSEEVRVRLGTLFEKLDSIKRFYRSERYKTPEAFRRVSQVLTKYELASIYARRENLWSIS